MSLQEKYQSLLDLANENGTTYQLSGDDNVLHVDGTAPSEDAKNALWAKYEELDPEFRSGDLILNITLGDAAGGDGAIFEATHGSAPKYKGQNKVNPTALILSAKLMLEHLGEATAAAKLEQAVADVIAEGKDVTYDMKADRNDPTAVGTQQMAEAICRRIQQL